MEHADFEQWRAKEVSRLLALVETERRYYQEIVASVPVPMLVLSAEWKVVWANRAFRQEFAVRGDDLRGKTLDQLAPFTGLPRDLMNWLRSTHVPGAKPTALPAEVGGRPVHLSAIPIRTWDDEAEIETLLTLEAYTNFEEIPSAHVEQAAGDLARGYIARDAALPAFPAILWQADPATFRFHSVGGSAEAMLGFPESHWTARREFFEERIHPEDRARTILAYKAAIANHADATAEFRSISASGKAVWCRERVHVADINGLPMLLGVLVELGRQPQIEQQAVVAGRMDALHLFAGRAAHDLNNPLMIINGYGEEMLHSFSAEHPLRGDLTEIMGATKRIAKLANRMTEFTRFQADSPVEVDLAALLKDLAPQLADAASRVPAHYGLPPGKAAAPVNLDLTCSADGAAEIVVRAAPEHLKEVLLALVTPNGAALEQSPSPRTQLSISCRYETMTETAARQVLTPGDYVRIEIRDGAHRADTQRSDTQMAARASEVTQAEAAFDPDFTPAGSLALARAYSYVRQWGGDLACSVDATRGAAYWMYLPAVKGPRRDAVPAQREAAKSEPQQAPLATIHHTEATHVAAPEARETNASESETERKIVAPLSQPQSAARRPLTIRMMPPPTPIVTETVAVYEAEIVVERVPAVILGDDFAGQHTLQQPEPPPQPEPAPEPAPLHVEPVQPAVEPLQPPVEAVQPTAEQVHPTLSPAETPTQPQVAPQAAPVPHDPVAQHGIGQQPPAPGESEGIRETILVVDDEAGIRGLMRKILRRERYGVLEAASAEEAQAVAAAAGRKINLLLTDVMLPGMQGPELAKLMYAADPQLKVLYISGYTEDESTRAGEYPPGSKFLAKPFTLGALLSHVRATLDAQQSAS